MLLWSAGQLGLKKPSASKLSVTGSGHLIPFAPTTTALRCLLTHRVNGTPWRASAGVFLGADMLDRAALLPLVLYPLASQVLPPWQRVLMSGLVVQSVALCLLLLAGGRITGVGLRVCRKFGTGKLVKRGMATTGSVMTGVVDGVELRDEEGANGGKPHPPFDGCRDAPAQTVADVGPGCRPHQPNSACF